MEVAPNATPLHRCRSNYFYPEVPFYSFESALDRMENLIGREHNKTKIKVEYPVEPPEIGSPHYGWMIFPYVKYDLRFTFTKIVKKLEISFESFHKGFDYLLNVCTVLLPYYPLEFQQYMQFFFLFWTDYEEFIREFFSLLPCHVSITKVNDALLIYASIKEGGKLKIRFFNLCYSMLEMGLVNRFWSTVPAHHWVPDVYL